MQSQLHEKLTLVTTTHLLASAPRTWVISRMLSSCRRRLAGTIGCRHVIYYDAPGERRFDELSKRYEDALRKLQDSFGFELVVREKSGLKSNYLHAIGQCKTPYMMFIEHDWLFLRRVQVAAVIETMDKHDFVNFIKFNVRRNDAHSFWDHFVCKEPRIAELPLTQTSCWTNNPHIIRVAKFMDSWRAFIDEKPAKGADGLEEVLYQAFNRDIFTTSFHEAQSRWGCYIYGGIRERRMIHHIDGRHSKSRLASYWEMYRSLLLYGIRPHT